MSVGPETGGTEKVITAFAAFAEKHALPDAVRRDVNVALDELLSNALSHGRAGREEGLVTVDVKLEHQHLTIILADDGPSFDPLAQATPDTTLSIEERSIGGLGIHLVRKLMDDVAYQRRDGQNIVTLTRRIAEAG